MFLLGRPSSKNLSFHSFTSHWDQIWQGDSSSKYTSIEEVGFQDRGHDVISRRKVLPSGDCTRSVCPALAGSSVYSSWSIHVFAVIAMVVSCVCTGTDVNECEAQSPCDHTCINHVGNYTCECYEGYQLYGVTHCAGLYSVAYQWRTSRERGGDFSPNKNTGARVYFPPPKF